VVTTPADSPLVAGIGGSLPVYFSSSAARRVRHGDGGVHLFGFRSQYRGWSQAAFRLLFRAIPISHDEPK